MWTIAGSFCFVSGRIPFAHKQQQQQQTMRDQQKNEFLLGFGFRQVIV